MSYLFIFLSDIHSDQRLLPQPDVAFVFAIAVVECKDPAIQHPRTDDWSQQRPVGVNAL